MPFDRLPGHSLKTPEYHPYIPPPRPVIPWAQYIVPAVDKIAQSLAYTFSPYEKQMRGAELAKAQVGQMEAQQNLALARPTMDLKRKELEIRGKQTDIEGKMLEQWGKQGYGGFDPGDPTPHYVPSATGMPSLETPTQAVKRASDWQDYKKKKAMSGDTPAYDFSHAIPSENQSPQQPQQNQVPFYLRPNQSSNRNLSQSLLSQDDNEEET